MWRGRLLLLIPFYTAIREIFQKMFILSKQSFEPHLLITCRKKIQNDENQKIHYLLKSQKKSKNGGGVFFALKQNPRTSRRHPLFRLPMATVRRRVAPIRAFEFPHSWPIGCDQAFTHITATRDCYFLLSVSFLSPVFWLRLHLRPSFFL